MERDFITLMAWVGGYAVLCWLFRQKLTEFALFCAIVLTPFSHAAFVPQQLFGLAGINPLNAVWLVAAFCVLRGAFGPEFRRAVTHFFGWPLLAFGALHGVAVLRTACDVEALLPFNPDDRPTAMQVLVFAGIKPVQWVLTGFLVCLYGIRNRTLDAGEKALSALPLVLACVVVVHYAIGTAADLDPSLYRGRQSISDGLSIHANYIGRMALYLLLWIITARESPWVRLRPYSVFACVVSIALSFSRTAYLAGALLVPIALRRSTRVERLWVVGSVIVVALALYPQLSERVQYGLESPEEPAAQDGAARDDGLVAVDEISAGRTGRIWPLVWPNVTAHPWVGQGLLSVWKPVDRDRGLNYDHPHNAYLEVVLDTGLVGLVGLVCLLWWIWRVGAGYPPLRFWLVGWALMSVTGDSFYPRLQNSLNWIVLGMAIAATAPGDERVRGSVASEGPTPP